MNYIAIDAGGTWIKAARYDENLQTHDVHKVLSHASQGKAAYSASIREVIDQYTGTDHVIGLALPGVLSADRRHLRYLPNVPGLEVGSSGMPLQELLGSSAQARVIVENDANCAAVGEWARGVPQGDTGARLLHLTWGTGIGTGFVAEGVVQPGWEGGHMPIAHTSPAAITCACGSKCDVEAYAAVPHLLTLAERGLHLGKTATTLTDDDFSNQDTVARRLVDLAEAGDALCLEIITTALAALATGLKAMAVITYPTQVTIGGGFMDRDWLLEKIREYAGQDSSSVVNDALKPEMLHRAKVGNEAGLLGAAMLAKQRFG